MNPKEANWGIWGGPCPWGSAVGAREEQAPEVVNTWEKAKTKNGMWVPLPHRAVLRCLAAVVDKTTRR